MVVALYVVMMKKYIKKQVRSSVAAGTKLGLEWKGAKSEVNLKAVNLR